MQSSRIRLSLCSLRRRPDLRRRFLPPDRRWLCYGIDFREITPVEDLSFPAKKQAQATVPSSSFLLLIISARYKSIWRYENSSLFFFSLLPRTLPLNFRRRTDPSLFLCHLSRPLMPSSVSALLFFLLSAFASRYSFPGTADPRSEFSSSL